MFHFILNSFKKKITIVERIFYSINNILTSNEELITFKRLLETERRIK